MGKKFNTIISEFLISEYHSGLIRKITIMYSNNKMIDWCLD